MIGLPQLQLIHEAAAEGDLIGAANLAFMADESEVRVSTHSEAFLALKALEKNLSDQSRFMEVAVLLWGNGLFDSRPSVVQDVFREVMANHRLVILGGSSLSKTFSCGVLFYLFWRMDAYWTAVKLAGPSEDHLRGNLFSHLAALHRGAVIPMTEDDKKFVTVNETDLLISMNDALPEMAIKGILCKQNQVSSSGLRGHKPKTYRRPVHPKYGNLTRLYILIDEATHVSPGAFEDIKTTEQSINPGLDNVKIVMTLNPEGTTYKAVELAEPVGGWDAEQVDTLYSWRSAKGYPCLRLDAKRFENVTEKRVIYPNMATYESFMDLLASGEHSGSYWAKGRGFPPLKDNAWTVIPPSWVTSQRGEPIYIGKVQFIGAEDTALGGGDKALWGIGRWGEASGWTKANGEVEWFTNRADPDKRITKHVMVLDQIFQLPKSDNTVTLVQELMGRAKAMEIPPENIVLDKGGNASGVWSHAKKFWGDVLGVDSGEKASEDKILADDQMTAYDIYERKVTELWFAAKRWLDPVVGAVYISPHVPMSPLFHQLTSRRFRNVKGGRVQVEPKHEYRARNQGVSPDEADCMLLLVEWCRQRGGVTPGIMETKKNSGEPYQPVSLQNADDPEPLETAAEWQPNRLEEV